MEPISHGICAPCDEHFRRVNGLPIRDPHWISYTKDEWATVTDAAAAFGVEPAVFVRRISLKAVMDLAARDREAAARAEPF